MREIDPCDGVEMARRRVREMLRKYGGQRTTPRKTVGRWIDCTFAFVALAWCAGVVLFVWMVTR